MIPEMSLPVTSPAVGDIYIFAPSPPVDLVGSKVRIIALDYSRDERPVRVVFFEMVDPLNMWINVEDLAIITKTGE